MKQITIDELPPSVKRLPSVGRQMYMRVYNRAIKVNSHRKATDAAWNVVRQFYKKGTKGQWRKIT